MKKNQTKYLSNRMRRQIHKADTAYCRYSFLIQFVLASYVLLFLLDP